MRQEVNGKGTTVKQIGREVAADIEYVKFWRAFRERVGPQGAGGHDSAYSTSLGRRPRSISATDCSLPIRVSGKKTLTQFFLGVLPFSSYTFGEFVSDQKLPTLHRGSGADVRLLWRRDPVPGGGQS